MYDEELATAVRTIKQQADRIEQLTRELENATGEIGSLGLWIEQLKARAEAAERELAEAKAARDKLLKAIDQDGIAVGENGYYRNWRAEKAEARAAAAAAQKHLADVLGNALQPFFRSVPMERWKQIIDAYAAIPEPIPDEALRERREG